MCTPLIEPGGILCVDGAETGLMTGDCQKFDRLIEKTSPFLFPFVLEYSLIAMGTLAVMYSAVDEANDEQANTLRRIQNLFRIPALSANCGISIHSPDRQNHTLQYLIINYTAVSQKKLVPNFGDNFVVS